MIWNLLHKLWPPSSGSIINSDSITITTATTKRSVPTSNGNISNISSSNNNGEIYEETSTLLSETISPNNLRRMSHINPGFSMERTRSNKSKFSRRMRREFAALPQDDPELHFPLFDPDSKEAEEKAKRKFGGHGRKVADIEENRALEREKEEKTKELWTELKKRLEKEERLQQTHDQQAGYTSDYEEHVCDARCPLVTHGICPNAIKEQREAEMIAQRRSSFTSGSSRDSNTSVSATGSLSSRRPHPLASLSIDNLPGSVNHHDHGAIKSPGLLSTASMWSTSDLHVQPTAPKPESDNNSHVGTNSLSNVSGSFSERMHELVRAFSSRTQRAKEKISQPPTPSSDSDYDDAKSAISGLDEPQGPRNIRLGSFFPMGSRTSDAFSDANHDHFVGVWHCKFKTPKFIKKLKFPSTLEPHSKSYVTWLFLVTMAFLYNAIVIPLRGVFPYQTEDNVKYWFIADYFCDFIYLMDIMVFKVRLRFANEGLVVCDRKETKKHYLRKWMFKFDVFSLTPLDILYLVDEIGVNPWLRLPRLFKIQTFWDFYERCDQASRSTQHAIRIIKTMTYMLYLIHIETCGYYAVSAWEGIGSNDWVYNGKGIAYVRCFYLATKTATSIGNNPKPTNSFERAFMTFYWLSGVFVFALLIGQIRDIVEAAGLVKANYRKKMDACLWYMQSINLPMEMQDRVREWFLYNWEQQKTIDERSLVSALPLKLQTDLAINVHFNTLSKVQLFQDCEKNLLYDLVLKLKPILYLPGDYVCQKGEVGKEMYIVSQGQVEVLGGENNETVLATLQEGSVFGEISLLAIAGRGNRRTADVRCKGYTNVFTLSKHDFEMAMNEYPEAQSLLKKRAKKLLRANAKIERKNKTVGAEEIIKTPPGTPKLLQTVIQVMDPDSNVVKKLTPSIKLTDTHNRSFRRPVSRSHSHRLSPSQSYQRHLTPPRSHSFRHITSSQKSPSNTLDPGLLVDKEVKAVEALDSDEQDEQLVFGDSSDDVSLSEVLHGAGGNSSFDDDDDEEDELLVIEQYEEISETDKNSNPQGSRTPSAGSGLSGGSGFSSRQGSGSNVERDFEGSEPDDPDVDEGSSVDGPRLGNYPRTPAPPGDNGNEKRSSDGEDRQMEEEGEVEAEGRKVSAESDLSSVRSGVEGSMPSGDSQDSGLPDGHRSDSQGSTCIIAPELLHDGTTGSKKSSRNSGRGSKNSGGRISGRNSDGNGTEQLTEVTLVAPVSKNNEANRSREKLAHEDSLENYTEKQIRSKSVDPVLLSPQNDKNENSSDDKSSYRLVRKAGPAHLTLSDNAIEVSETGSRRVRKLSVVTPPHSPAGVKSTPTSPYEKHNRNLPSPPLPSPPHWVTNSTQVISLKNTGSDVIMKCFTPVETVPIQPLPPIETHFPSRSVSPRVVNSASSPEGSSRKEGSSRPVAGHASPPPLTNGLESCCGGGPIVEIPTENRVTCAVEIHRQKSISSSTTDIHGHTETML